MTTTPFFDEMIVSQQTGIGLFNLEKLGLLGPDPLLLHLNEPILICPVKYTHTLYC
jgi:hypothetical protein